MNVEFGNVIFWNVILSCLLFLILYIYIKGRRERKLEEDGEREVSACPRCGSPNISGLKHLKNWLKRFGPVMGVYTCQKCGYEGPPIIFDSKEKYEKFIKLKRKK